MKGEGVIKVGYFQSVFFGQIDRFSILVFEQVPGVAIRVSNRLVPPVLQVSRVTIFLNSFIDSNEISEMT